MDHIEQLKLAGFDTNCPVYEIRTIEDFKQVPVDRLDACFADFKKFLDNQVSLDALFNDKLEELDIDLPIGNLRLTTFYWVDDGKNSIVPMVDLLGDTHILGCIG